MHMSPGAITLMVLATVSTSRNGLIDSVVSQIYRQHSFSGFGMNAVGPQPWRSTGLGNDGCGVLERCVTHGYMRLITRICFIACDRVLKLYKAEMVS
jgi:hypothetical protein